MSSPVIDSIWPRLVTLAATLNAVLDEYDAAVCRTFVAPGSSPPWDVCCECRIGREGQAWVAVDRIVHTSTFPSGDAAPLRCSPREYAVDLSLGVLRCAHTVSDGGEPPSVDQLLADAEKVSRDRVLMVEALVCRFGEDADLLPGGLVLRDWTPLGPQGGCVGGRQQATIAVSVCACQPPAPVEPVEEEAP